MSDVFISYSRKDKEFVHKLIDALTAKKRDAWVDWEDIPATADWLAEIRTAIQAADTFVFVLSPDSIASQVCSEEIAHAVKNNKRLVPIVCRDVNPRDVNPALAQLNWIFFRASDDFEVAFATLLKALDTDLEWVRAHTRLLTRAVEWESQKRNDAFVLRGADLRAAEEWLAQVATGKEPKPTPLQSEYILASRRAATRTQRITLAGVTMALVVAIVLALAALYQGDAANNARITAVAETNVRATAEANAVNQARISESRRLAVQSTLYREKNPTLALLLGVQAYSLDANVDVRTNLLDSLLNKPQIICYLHGHTWIVWDTTFSPDGQLLASASGDNTIILWDLHTYQPIGSPLIGHKAIVRSVAFSPDGQTLASASDDNTIILWNVSTHQPIGQPLVGHRGTVFSVAFSPDGKTLASASDDNTIILWNVDTHQPISQPLVGHTERVDRVVFSPNGKMLASGSLDQTVILWDVATRQRIGEPLIGHTTEVLSVAFSPDGATLASGSGSGYDPIILWNVDSQKEIGQLQTSEQQFRLGVRPGVTSVVFSPDGSTLASGHEDNSVILWNVSTQQPLGQPLTGHTGRVNSVAFSPDGSKLASGSSDVNDSIILWDLHSPKSLGQPIPGSSDYAHMAFSLDGKTVALNEWATNNITLWDVTTRQSIDAFSILPMDMSEVDDLAFSADGKMLAIGGCHHYQTFGNSELHCATGDIVLRDVNLRQPIGQPLVAHKATVRSVAYSPDGQTLASASDDNTIILWNVSTQQPISPPLVGHTEGVDRVVFSPDGRMLASLSKTTIILWDVATHQPIDQPLREYAAGVFSVAFSSDSKTLAWGSCGSATGGLCNNGQISLWDIAMRKEIGQPLRGHTTGVLAIAFSPDGKTLASGSYDDGLYLWDVATQQQIGQPLDRSGVYQVAFSSDGKTLVSRHFSKVVLWDADLESWKARACAMANRNITRNEWALYVNPDLASYHAVCPGLPLEP